MDRTDGRSYLARAPFFLAISCALVLPAFWIARYFLRPLGHDPSVLLFEAQRFLSGDEIYGPHIRELNPPVIIWLSSVPVLLSRLVPIPVVFLFYFLVVLMVCTSAAWCVCLLARSGKVTNGMALALYGFAILLIELFFSHGDFGQREHLLVILVFPYLLAIATSVASRLSPAERCALGVAAGIAIWLKPQQILVVIVLELANAFRTRSLRHALSFEFISMVFTASVLLVLVLACTPLYLSRVIPLLSDVYWAYATNTFSSLLYQESPYVLTALVVLLGSYLFRSRLKDWTVPAMLLVCSIGGYLAFAVQETDWQYHLYPSTAFLFLALCYLLADIFDPFLERIRKAPVFRGFPALALSGCILLVAMVFALYPAIRKYPVSNAASSPFDQFLSQLQPGTVVYVPSTSALAFASVYNAGLKWGSGYPNLWMLPAILQNETGRTSMSHPFKKLSPQRTSQLADMQRREIAEDLNEWQPAIILIPHCTRVEVCQGIEGKNVDLLAWFQRSPDFARIWSRYERQQGINGYEVYRLAR